jgi:tight adherence protein B
MALLIAALVFCFLVTLVVGTWWVAESRRRMRERLGAGPLATPSGGLLREDPRASSTWLAGMLGHTMAWRRLEALAVQAGYRSSGDVAVLILASGFTGGVLAWLRTGTLVWGLLAAPLAAALPVLYLAHKRQRRLRQFEAQFPEALDMIGRAVRAGNALSGAIRLVAEEMPDPVGAEFRQVSEEIRLGMDPGEALFRLQSRVPVDDMAFFGTAIRIQRGVGGNLAEVLDRLAEVIRERFKILSYARVLQAQHKWSAIMVGLSPVLIALVFQMLNPGYFNAMLTDPMGPYLISAGVAFEVVGFFVIWRIAQIRV